MAEHPHRFELVQWVAGDLDADASTAVDEHLTSCPECRSSAEGIRADAERFEQGREDHLAALKSRLATDGQPGVLVRMPTRRWWGWGLGASAAAVAAAVILALAFWPQAPVALPEYSLEFRGGDKVVRGVEPDGPVARLRPSSRLEITLRPAVPLADPASADLVVLLQSPAGLVPLSWVPRVAASGTFMVEGRVSELLPAPPGRYALWLVVCPAGKSDEIPSSPDRLREPPVDGPWQAESVSLELIQE